MYPVDVYHTSNVITVYSTALILIVHHITIEKIDASRNGKNVPQNIEKYVF